MNLRIQESIVKTLCYGDIFDYPLTGEEIRKWLIKLKIKNAKLKTTIKNLKSIKTRNEYFFLAGRDKLVKIRLARKKWSEKKLMIAEKVAKILLVIPTVKLIGVTGGLAMKNAKKDDDIDLFIVTSKGLLWTTRFLVTILLEFTGNRRHPHNLKMNNKVCLNMYADENHLAVPKKEQDLFSAHEVLQMKPILDNENTYQKFISKNKWVTEFLPHALDEIMKKSEIKKLKDQVRKSNKLPYLLIIQLLLYIENFLKKFQLWYMRKRRTKEVIREGFIRFHPHDARVWVLKKYRLRYSNVLTSDKLTS